MIATGLEPRLDVDRGADAPPSPLERAARERLEGSGYLALHHDILCEVVGDEARLSGRLSSRHLKQVALAVVVGVEGVRTILDRIEVVPRPGRSATALVARAWGGGPPRPEG